MEQIRQIVIKWLNKAMEELATGEELAFPAETKDDQIDKKKIFMSELKILHKIDPVAASEIQITSKFRDHRFWIIIRKIAFSPLIAFKKKIDGTVERVLMEDTTEKFRRFSLMKEDGYSIEDIMEMEDDLTEEDIEFLKRERR